jgi:hypothetical protein
MSALDEAAVIRALLQVPGVAAAHIDTSAEGEGLLQLDLTPAADEVLLAAAVRRVLRDRFGLGVAVERIETGADGGSRPAEIAGSGDPLAAVFQLRPALLAKAPQVAPNSPPPPPAASPTAPTPPPQATPGPASPTAPAARPPELDPAAPVAGVRPHVGRLQVSALELGAAVSIELTWAGASFGGGHTTVGKAEGPTTPEGVRRAVAEAALRAVNAEVGPKVRLDLGDFTVVPLGQHKVAVVRIILSSAAGVTALTGASDVRDDVRQALVRAILMATNRRLLPP